MVTKQVLAQGMQVRHIKGSDAKVVWSLQHTQARWLTLQWAIVARASNIRAAARKARRMAGQPLTPLPFASKYRTKGRRRAA